ncbi:MAG: cobalamin-dependent protein [Chloroflexota bacterium]
MDKTADGGLKTIGQVVRELSDEYEDITHSSLRFLEREKLVEPERTPGGHRLYSPYHVERIRQIKEWQKSRLSLDEIRHRLIAADTLDPPESLARQFLTHAIAGDLPGAQKVILHADELGLPLMTTFEYVLKPALYDLGDRWEGGELSVGQEKEISALARDLIAELSLRHASTEWRPESIIAACVPGEYHELGLRMVAGVLQSRGYVVHYLGPNVDAEFLIERINHRKPSAVLLTATRDEHVPAIISTVTEVREAIPPHLTPPIVVGGQVVRANEDRLRDLSVATAPNTSIQETIDAITRSIRS